MIEIKTERRIDAGCCDACAIHLHAGNDCAENVEVIYVGIGKYSDNSLRFCPACFAAFAAVVAGHKARLGKEATISVKKTANVGPSTRPLSISPIGPNLKMWLDRNSYTVKKELAREEGE